MRPDFHRQEKGILKKPANVSKWHIAWSLDNVLEGFKEFYREHQRWPMGEDLDDCGYLPNVKTIDRKFGGLKKVRELLGLEEIDYRTGERRSKQVKEIWERGFKVEQELRDILIGRFHEPFVHQQGRIIINDAKWVKVDFLVYHRQGKFAVDVFYPKGDKRHYANNIAAKYRVYKDFPYVIYLVIANEQVTDELLIVNQTVAKQQRNPNAILTSYPRFHQKLGDYEPLPNPYS